MPYKTRKPKKDTPPPTTELELQELQRQFLADRNNQEVHDKFFYLLRNYARSIALKNIKRTNIFLPPERVDEICTDATLSVFEQYYNNPNWSIEISFAGILFWKVNAAMYGQADEEKTFSLNSTFDDDDSQSKEIMDVVSFNADLPWNSEINGFSKSIKSPDETIEKTIDVSYEEVNALIDDAFLILPYRLFMRFVPWLVLQFRKPKTRNIQSLFVKTFLTSKEENAFDLLLLELHNRIIQHT